MPKKSFDVMPLDPNKVLPAEAKIQRKTERTHEENQERAYVAASRRADRSIEARVQSARMASEIHKKRTGKGFRISEEIVMKEEMYEEEEDDLPRSIAMSHMVAGTNEEWRMNEINRLFEQSFPNASQQIHQYAQHMPRHSSHPVLYAEPQPMEHQVHSPTAISPSFQHINYQALAGHHNRTHSLSAVSPGDYQFRDQTHSPAVHTPSSGSGSDNIRAIPSRAHSDSMTPDTPMEFGPPTSVFTAELPAEARILMTEVARNDSFDQSYPTNEWTAPDMYFHDASGPMKMAEDHMTMPSHTIMPGQYFNDAAALGPAEETWEMYLDDSAWNNNDQPGP